MRPRKIILIISDDKNAAGVLTFVLDMNGYHALATNGSQEELSKILKECSFDLALFQFPLANCINLLAAVKKENRSTPCMVVRMCAEDQLADNIFSDYVLYLPSIMELLERIRIMTVRKRGPKKAVPVQILDSQKISNG